MSMFIDDLGYFIFDSRDFLRVKEGVQLLRISFILLFALGVVFIVDNNLPSTEPTQPAKVRVIEHVKTAFTDKSVVENTGSGVRYSVEKVSFSEGSLLHPTSWKIKNIFSREDSWEIHSLGRGVVAEAEAAFSPVSECDLVCNYYRARTSFLRFVKSQMNENLCAECTDEKTLAHNLLVGGNIPFSQEVKKQLIENSLYHIVVVSGLQVALLCLMIEKLFESLSMPVVMKTLLLLTLLTIYGFITGFDPPVVRTLTSVLISSIVLLFLGRGIHPLRLFFYTVCLCLLLFPSYLFSVSFQLSCVTTLAVVWVGLLLDRKTLWLVRDGLQYLASNAMALVFLSEFGSRISPFGILANLIVLPTLPLATLTSLFMIMPVIGKGFGMVFELLSKGLFAMLDTFSSLSRESSLLVSFEKISGPQVWLWYSALIVFGVTSVVIKYRLTKNRT